MFPSVNTDITILGLPKICAVATVSTNTAFFFHLDTVFVHFKKTVQKDYINESLKEYLSLNFELK